jgi:cobalt/nickel transport protein
MEQNHKVHNTARLAQQKRVLLAGLITAVFVALVVSPFASRLPDGLERVTEDIGLMKKAGSAPPFPAFIPDYIIPAVRSDRLSKAVAGLTGTLIVFGIGYTAGMLLKRQKANHTSAGGTD